MGITIGSSIQPRPKLRKPATTPMMAMIADGQSAENLSHRFAEVLRHRREAAGLSRMELATAAKLSYQTICNVESGRNMPAPLTVACLRNVEALGLGDLEPKPSAVTG